MKLEHFGFYRDILISRTLLEMHMIDTILSYELFYTKL